MEQVDLLIVGGGINGAGIARDAAGRGLTVILVEKDDLAAHTSSASSKLIHGGLRYLEQLELKLVRQSLVERERLLRAAPHIVRPLQFVIPPCEAARPRWMVRAGLFLYDHLGSRQLLPGSRSVRLDGAFGEGLRRPAPVGLAYWDCQVQDSRLVILNAIDAAERGATILTRTEMIEARRDSDFWTARLRQAHGDRTVQARSLVNAAGPWASQLFERISGARPHCRLRLVKGSHVVVPRLYAGTHAFLLQNPDKRVVFAIPFEREFTLVGTTDVEWEDPGRDPRITEAEIDYLLGTLARYFSAPPRREDIVWSYSGIRALVDDGRREASKVTREYVLDMDAPPNSAPLLSVFGGKITTYRALAERAVDRIASKLGIRRSRWTEDAVLPGGDIPDLDVERHALALWQEYAQVPADLLSRLAGTYGTRASRLLGGVRCTADLGEHFGTGLYAREVDYLVSEEWARSAEDVLFRRTKLGLRIPTEGVGRLAAYMGSPDPP